MNNAGFDEKTNSAHADAMRAREKRSRVVGKFPPERVRGNIPVLPMPQGLVERSAVLAGEEHSWFEYVPSSCEGEAAVPLLIGLHGGGGTGAQFAAKTMFTRIADEEGFICVFPNATSWYEDEEGRHHMWNGFFGDTFAFDETVWLKELIDLICKRYAIDRQRIYLTGHSNGDEMAFQLAVKHPELFAACAGLNGPSHIDCIIDQQGRPVTPHLAVPYFRWNGELDPLTRVEADRATVVEMSNAYWRRANRCGDVPLFRLDGKLNTMIYPSACGAEFRFTEYKGGPHALNIEVAHVVWHEFFNRFARAADGSVIAREVPDAAPPDEGAVALVSGSRRTLVNGKVTEIAPGNEHAAVPEKEGELFAPVSFLAGAFGAELRWNAGERKAELVRNGKRCRLAADDPVLQIDHQFFQWPTPPFLADGLLWAPAEMLARKLFARHVSSHEGVMYVSDRETELSATIAREIARIVREGEAG